MRQNFARVARSFVLCAFVLAVGGRSARADTFLTPFVGVSFGGGALNCASLAGCSQQQRSWGVSAGTGHGIFGVEEDFSYVPDFYARQPGADNGVITLSSNMIVRFPDGKIRPYALGGLAFVRPHSALNASGFAGDRNVLGYDVGGGVTDFMHQHIGVRTDLRYIRGVKDLSLGDFSAEPVHYWRGSAGVTFVF